MLVSVALLTAPACTGSSAGPPSAGQASLAAFGSCDAALEGLREALRSGAPAPQPADREGAVVAQGAAPAGAVPDVRAEASAPAHSTTNNHEQGVEEPDIVQTDGRRIVTVADGRLRVLDAATRTQTSTLDLPGGGRPSRLLLDGDRALVAGQDGRLTLVDLAGAPRTIGTLSVPGTMVDARLVNGRARVVLHTLPRFPRDVPMPQPAAAAGAMTLDDWLPRYELEAGGRSESGRLVDCDRVLHPRRYTATGMLTVLSIDLAGELGTGEPVTIAADGRVVYGTAETLYVAHDATGRTEIHAFDITGAGPARHVASGVVEGTLLNQYAMSEHDGHLRVATTTGADNTVTVLARRGDRLTEAGRLGGLGKGERIYAVRYFGPVGYVVTFRQTDPLYTLDLADPAAPRAVGELKITGYSAYLHRAGEGRLIGVGQEADLQGRALGMQVSLFDVADPARPRRVAQHRLTGGLAQVESDTHAFLYWEPERLLVLPTDTDALVLRVGDGNLTERTRIAHATPVLRALVIGADLWTVSASGALVHDLATLTERSRIPFP
ncbi:hypothetical protein BAY60_10970 [Prauserella muralis]|uniref:Uncharacterized protein n=1 Tax=Prauserella muralis TaxID=588067 RepID=A0A2V4AYG2_9PSEU|nr:hypothetical protein BAY60_10970 [Prauserella muralis]TWE23368.1 beta propeller domain-containing protein [Prauserella muralis]